MAAYTSLHFCGKACGELHILHNVCGPLLHLVFNVLSTNWRVIPDWMLEQSGVF